MTERLPIPARVLCAALVRCAALVLCAGLSTAAAQDVGALGPAPGVGFLGVDDGRLTAVRAANAQLYVQYAHRPLVQRAADGAIERDHVGALFGVEALASYGVAEWLEVGLSAPAAHVSGDGLAELDREGLAAGDMRVLPRLALPARLLPDRRLTLSLAAPLSLPVGDERRHLGRAGVAFVPTMAAGWRGEWLRLAANVGYRLQSADDRLANVQVGDGVVYGAALGIGGATWSGFAELVGAVGLGAVADTSVVDPLEARVGLRWSPPFGGHLLLAGGVGVIPDVGAPAARVVTGFGLTLGAPPPAEPMPVEPMPMACVDPTPVACVAPEPPVVVMVEPEPPVAEPEPEPPVAEPEPVVAAPEPEPPAAEPEPVVAVPKPAAPPPGTARIVADEIVLGGEVRFATGSATLMPDSRALLDEVAATILDAFDLPFILVEGHTDDRGSARANLRLSDARAAAVRAYLIARGVAAVQLVAVGFGESRPRVEGKTAFARRQNRRVRFRLVEAEGLPRSIVGVQAEPSAVTIRADHPVPAERIEVATLEGGAVLTVRIGFARVERRYVELDAPWIRRALLHPTVDRPPAAVLRLRLTRPLPAEARPAVQVDGETVRIVLADEARPTAASAR